jgi:phospholipase C
VTAPVSAYADTGLAPNTTYTYAVTAFDSSAESAPSNQVSATTMSSGGGSPIRHVIVVVMENRTFDNVLGRLCANEGGRCDGATTGKKPDGTVVPLVAEPDLRPDVNHSHESQVKAIDGARWTAS